MKRKIAAFVCALAVAGTSQGFMPGAFVEAAKETRAAGTTYYFSNDGDNVNNDGTTENKPWQTLDKLEEVELQPGDQILLKSGSVFRGYIHLKDVQGTKEAPIKIGSYGTGNKPIIQTDGQGIWYQDYGKQFERTSDKYQGYVSSSILLYDSEYIEIEGLEITNGAPAKETAYNGQDVMDRTGVSAVAKNKGTLDHIYLKNLHVHDVAGNVYDKQMNNGGISFTQLKPDQEASTGAAKYDDIKIENCYVEDVSRTGIAVGSTYHWDKFRDGEIEENTASQYGSTKVVIRNNYIKDAGGDGIVLMYCDGAVVENNVADGSAKQMNAADHSAVETGRAASAVAPWKCKDTVLQFNEAFDTQQNEYGQAWDMNAGEGTVYQYNYSHNNSGGTVSVRGNAQEKSIFRYNISQNDLRDIVSASGSTQAHVYNNTFYVKDGVDFMNANMSGGSLTTENNIIYYSGSAQKQEQWFGQDSDKEKYKYDSNAYYNYAAVPDTDAHKITADPKMADPGKAPTASTSAVHNRTDFDGYKLAADSPVIHKGKFIPDNGGRDFFGNTFTGFQSDIGAYQSNTPSTESELRVYSSAYDVTDDTIGGVTGGITVADFKKNLVYDTKFTVQVLKGTASAADTDTLTEEMKLKISDGNQSKEYTIAFKKSYTYADYTRTGWTASAGSANSDRPASNALDNNMTTLWHSNFAGADRNSTWISIDMKEAKKISRLTYYPKQNGTGDGALNGTITRYAIYVSSNGTDWGTSPVAEGTWEMNADAKYAYFEEVTAQYVKLVAIESFGADSTKNFTAATEILLGYKEAE